MAHVAHAKADISRKPVFRPIGDKGMMMEFGKSIDPETNMKIRRMTACLEKNPPKGVREVIPTYSTIILIYDPMETDADSLIHGLDTAHASLDTVAPLQPVIVELPVCYHASLAPDMEYVAQVNKLTPKEVVEIHTAPLYLIYMIGFAPGFPYLGGLSEKIHAPRLSTPRSHVPAGSVGIANNQTGIYPIDSPGGWRLIGQCPIKLFDPLGDPPILLCAGEKIRFKAIPLDEFHALKGGYKCSPGN